MSAQQQKQLSESNLTVLVYGVSIAVVLVVVLLMTIPNVLKVGSFDVSYAPLLHACINGACSVLLIAGLIAIKAKKIVLHRTFMMSTFVLSSLFLVSYVIYHSQKAAPVRFGGEGTIAYIYFFILITHIVLAAVILPFALFTISRAWRGEYEKHKKIARYTFPLWLYVTVTGVLVYLMLYVWYTPLVG
jgi:putative membrane protein